jgi:glutathione S-transferase
MARLGHGRREATGRALRKRTEEKVLDLYHYEPYANSMKVMMCIREKGVAFTPHYVDLLKFEQHVPEFLALNPNGQVPILVHDGRVVTESTMINEYLDDTFPDPPLRPAEPYERARMRVFSKFVDDVLMPSVSRLGWQFRFRDFAQSIPDGEFAERMARVPLEEIREKWSTIHGAGFSDGQLEDARRQIRRAIERLEAMLATSDWLCGGAYSLADINAYPNVEGAFRNYGEYCDRSRGPRTAEWLARVAARPATQAAFAMSRFGNRPGVAVDAADAGKRGR